MKEIKLSAAESHLWHESGTRGDAFRRATADRAAEQVRIKQEPIEIVDSRGQTVDTVTEP
jgi:hypothetical protein